MKSHRLLSLDAGAGRECRQDARAAVRVSNDVVRMVQHHPE
jgi:hypothetical protein